MMYNPQLETFMCVVESGSFSKAAEKLYISSPAVIKQINSLEASLGIQLFSRTHRGLVVTEAGKSIYNDSKYIIGYCKDSVKRAKDAMQVSEDVIRVGVSPLTPPQIFVELWPKIQKLYPDMKFKLITFENTSENAREILANLGQNIDVVAGVFDESLLELRGCAGVEISKEPFCVAVSIHHRLAKKDVITFDDMKNETLMIMQRGWSSNGDKLRDDIIENYPEISYLILTCIILMYLTDVRIIRNCCWHSKAGKAYILLSELSQLTGIILCHMDCYIPKSLLQK